MKDGGNLLITQSELDAFIHNRNLRAAVIPTPDCFTTRDLAQKLGISESHAGKHIHAAVLDGTIVILGRRGKQVFYKNK